LNFLKEILSISLSIREEKHSSTRKYYSFIPFGRRDLFERSYQYSPFCRKSKSENIRTHMGSLFCTAAVLSLGSCSSKRTGLQSPIFWI